MSANPSRLMMPSCMRAPPESMIPTIGHPVLIARPISLTIFFAPMLLRVPPSTVKSYANTNVCLPDMSPYPPTTPSVKNFFFCMSYSW